MTREGARVGAVVVAYFPDAGFPARVQAMARQVGRILVVDNSGDAEVAGRLRSLTAQDPQIALLDLQENRGLGAALNLGFQQWKNAGCQTVIAFDQDSTPDPGCVDALVEVAGRFPRAAVVGSNWRDEARPDVAVRHLIRGTGCRPWFRRVMISADRDDVTFVITSGSLFRLGAWESLGGFREDLFVDQTDTEYCLRARLQGWGIAVAAKAALRHRRGNKQPVRWAGRTWWPAHMPPTRIQLVVRNRVWMGLRYGWRNWPWLLFEASHTVFLGFSVLFLEPHSSPSLREFFRGSWDGLRGRLGRPAIAAARSTSASAVQTTPS